MPLLFILLLYLPYDRMAEVQKVDPCRLYGSVYIEKNRSTADYFVYVEETEAFADLVVYKEENQLFADKEGLWHFTENKGFADFSIYYEETESFADFSIAFTDAASFSGCN